LERLEKPPECILTRAGITGLEATDEFALMKRREPSRSHLLFRAPGLHGDVIG
jgi:hypothetical protein